MNSLLIFPEELRSATEAVLTGRRALHTRELHGLTEGVTVRAAFLNRGLGDAEVIESTDERVVLRTRIQQRMAKNSVTELIVAVPRPQTVKKIVSTAAMMGVTAIHFVRAARCEKSYLDSNSLSQSAINDEVIKGLEQAYACDAPEVIVHRRFKPFVQDYLADRIKQFGRRKLVGVIADTARDAKENLAGIKVLKSTPVLIAIGPELGWNEFELEQFKACGFNSVSLGARILRVEVAATAMLAQVALLRALGNKKAHLPHR